MICAKPGVYTSFRRWLKIGSINVSLLTLSILKDLWKIFKLERYAEEVSPNHEIDPKKVRIKLKLLWRFLTGGDINTRQMPQSAGVSSKQENVEHVPWRCIKYGNLRVSCKNPLAEGSKLARHHAILIWILQNLPLTSPQIESLQRTLLEIRFKSISVL